MKRRIKSNLGITLISLIITIIIMLILAGVVLSLTIGNDGLIENTKQAKEETNRQTAIEKISLKLTNSQMQSYAKEQRMPTLQEIANDFCEDEEIEYVELTSKKIASLEKIQVDEKGSFFTKLKKYPYEFEINSSLQLASIDGIDITNNTQKMDETTGYNDETGFYYHISGKFCMLWRNYVAVDNTCPNFTFPFEFEVAPSCQVTKTTNSTDSNNMVVTISTKEVYVDTNYGWSNKCSFSMMICGIIK